MLLTERVAGGGRVDREAGVVYGVKVLGRQSKNGRLYSAEAIERAKSMYEGRAVNADHPTMAGMSRSMNDRVGWLENVRIGPDGALYADLHLLLSDPRALKILEIAEKNPALLGLSHNAEGQTHQAPDGSMIVDEITEVHSVDVVADAATVNGLFEQKETVMTTERFVETITADEPQPEPAEAPAAPEPIWKARNTREARDKMRRLCAGSMGDDAWLEAARTLLADLPAPAAESYRRPDLDRAAVALFGDLAHQRVERNPWDGPTAGQTKTFVDAIS